MLTHFFDPLSLSKEMKSQQMWKLKSFFEIYFFMVEL